MASADGCLSELSIPVSEHGAWATAMNNLGILPVGLRGPPLLSDAVCIQRFDPGLLPPINSLMGGAPQPRAPPARPPRHADHQRDHPLPELHTTSPPPRCGSAPPAVRRCLWGGLPENATEEVVREVFDQCGEILALRKSKKNFCHLRYSEEFMVDKAMYLSGYRMRIGSSTEKKDSGRIHVDFAQARDDLYEWECQQRLLAREQRHLRFVHEDRLLPPSPPPIVHFSEHEAAMLAEKLKADDQTFGEATAVLFTWIDRGEVNRRTANNFYSMIQSANSHVRRLMSEKAQHEEEMERAKEAFKSALLAILSQFEQITGVFTAATRQKAWDHFSKAQRKNIDIWHKQCEELRSAHSEDITGIRREEEMEMSEDDSEESPCKRLRSDLNGVCDPPSMKEENDSLRWQLDAYRNEIQLLQQNMLSMQQQLLVLQEKLSSKEAELQEAREERSSLQGELCETEGPDAELHNKVNGGAPSLFLSRGRRREELRAGVASEKEALLLGVISTFLHVHPFGANLEYLWSYIQRLDSKVSAGELERLMLRLPSMFLQELSGVGANLEKRWKFCGFDSLGSA
ncbi:hypothetical protein CgunFtcFv8_024137 [Champsocephalus gunnari]|uniref:RRM domain-containing protein n=1 Tax=Champsocephalus gunnari TaxID=52237 RepID=A0AAN8DDR7_CHAGU|nr:hypothetical protein CgunFtcFv8_024137 [Champsocephalus gunnari]